MMTRLGLTLNEAKTSLRNARLERFDFLGYSFGPHRYKANGQWYPGLAREWPCRCPPCHSTPSWQGRRGWFWPGFFRTWCGTGAPAAPRGLLRLGTPRTAIVRARAVRVPSSEKAAMRGLWPWIEQASKRLHRNMLAIALANKLARIAWAVLARGRAYQPRISADAA